MAIQTLALLMWKSPKKTHITVSTPAGNTTTPIPSQQVKDSAGALFPPNSSTASSTPNYVVSTPQGLPALLTKPLKTTTLLPHTRYGTTTAPNRSVFSRQKATASKLGEKQGPSPPPSLNQTGSRALKHSFRLITGSAPRAGRVPRKMQAPSLNKTITTSTTRGENHRSKAARASNPATAEPPVTLTVTGGSPPCGALSHSRLTSRGYAHCRR